MEDISTFRWSIELDGPQVHRLLSTFSDWSAQEVERAVEAVVDLEDMCSITTPRG